jgi:hypothetical protein
MAEPKSAGTSRRAAVHLAEAFERVGQELWRKPLTRITTSCASAPDRRSEIVTRPPAGVNFTAFESGFHTICCSRPGSALT